MISQLPAHDQPAGKSGFPTGLPALVGADFDQYRNFFSENR
jgi:hypothetical protein